MRIRSIKPDFWRSDDITALDWETRLLFVGLWSYVDDNGVGRDKLADIAADLFAGDLEADSSETFARVSRGLQKLSEANSKPSEPPLITRYSVDGKHYLHISKWRDHQRIDKPNRERYPLPTCENAEIRETVATPSREPRETPAPGTGEQGNRGTGDKPSCSSAAAESEFDAFWQTYPRKVSKGQAVKAYRSARKKADADEILAGLKRHLPLWAGKDITFVPHAATWLNGERWADDPSPLTLVRTAVGNVVNGKCLDCGLSQIGTNGECYSKQCRPVVGGVDFGEMG